MPSAFLSNPAARPSGPGNSIPSAFTGVPSSRDLRWLSLSKPASTGRPARSAAKPTLWAFSASTLTATWSNSQRYAVTAFIQSWRERTPMSPARTASIPCTAAASPCTVVMHGMLVRIAAVRIS